MTREVLKMGEKKGAMYPLKVLGNLFGWMFLFGLVSFLVKRSIREKLNRD